ncbi:methyltransferase domain-containing protein [Fusibacter bizertensis]|uniref:Methyltransferase domain-containing protein n=1 Tax=Fusibacter bizertensis TaxID=1488331 RepID=A0ABT6NFW6_9FIRM|nr:methyltransferase domain-containing protein [Fusibacter bizertensis]MDH8679327.1 methyltransferase domain-containing protein [Fusibacter bizertensis]
MAHKFNPKHLDKLDNPERRDKLPPVETLEKLGFEAKDILVDIGAGIGYFTIASQEITKGLVPTYALDTSSDMLINLKAREIEITGKNHIQTILTDEYDFKLSKGVATFVLLVNVLHEIDDKTIFIRHIQQILKEHGKVAIIDWKKIEMPEGPPLKHRISVEETKKMLIELGFRIEKSLEFGTELYGLVATK